MHLAQRWSCRQGGCPQSGNQRQDVGERRRGTATSALNWRGRAVARTVLDFHNHRYAPTAACCFIIQHFLDGGSASCGPSAVVPFCFVERLPMPLKRPCRRDLGRRRSVDFGPSPTCTPTAALRRVRPFAPPRVNHRHRAVIPPASRPCADRRTTWSRAMRGCSAPRNYWRLGCGRCSKGYRGYRLTSWLRRVRRRRARSRL